MMMKTRFRKLGLLGSGSYGNVHLAALTSGSDDYGYSISPSSFTAVKSAKLHSPSAAFLAREKAFLGELVGSPFIVQGFGTDISIEKGHKTYNLIMEYAPGGTLKGLIKQKGGRMDEAEVACYTAMLLKGLSSAHEKGIVHCDMKPDNILVFPVREREGILNHHLVKIADFGLAKKTWEEDIVHQPGRASLHRGALLYASPESIRQGRHSEDSDVWALGCIVFEMLTGQPIWMTRTEQELIDKVTLDRPEIPDYVSDMAADFLEKCLERYPRRRWTTGKLLRHPFLATNASHFRTTDMHNPFVLDGRHMIRRIHTFSDYYAYPQQCFSYQPIVQENKISHGLADGEGRGYARRPKTV